MPAGDVLALRVGVDPDAVRHRLDIGMLAAHDDRPEVLVGERAFRAGRGLPRRSPQSCELDAQRALFHGQHRSLPDLIAGRDCCGLVIRQGMFRALFMGQHICLQAVVAFFDWCLSILLEI